MYRRFFTGISDIYKRNIGRKQNSIGVFFDFFAHNLDKILDRCRAQSRAIYRKTQYLTTRNLMLEFNILQRDRYETMPWKIYVGCYVGEFVEPL